LGSEGVHRRIARVKRDAERNLGDKEGCAPIGGSKAAAYPFRFPARRNIYIFGAFSEGQKIPLRVDGALKRVWWYLNSRFIGTSLPNETFFYAIEDGDHILSVLDSEGRTP
jgi:membrane carboxypeptidase/penicillin-binding protein PbpC